MAVNAGVSPGVVVATGEAVREFIEGVVWKCESPLEVARAVIRIPEGANA